MANVSITISLQGVQAVTSQLNAVQAGLRALGNQAKLTGAAVNQGLAAGIGNLGRGLQGLGVQAGYAAQGLAAAQRGMVATHAAAATATSGFSGFTSSILKMNGAINAGVNGLLSWKSLFVAGVTGAGIKGVIGLADSYTMLNSRLSLVSKTSEDQASNMKRVFDIAQDSRTPLDAVGITYSRIAINAERLGLSQDQVAKITATLAKSFILAGSTAEEAAGGMTQFTQALSKGKLDGDELRSVFENMPIVVKALEVATGLARGELYKLASQGRITASVLLGAVAEGGEKVNELFAKTPRTVGQAATQFANAFERMVGQANTGNKAVQGFIDALDSLRGTVQSQAFLNTLAISLTTIAKGAKLVADNIGLVIAVFSALAAIKLAAMFINAYRAVKDFALILNTATGGMWGLNAASKTTGATLLRVVPVIALAAEAAKNAGNTGGDFSRALAGWNKAIGEGKGLWPALIEALTNVATQNVTVTEKADEAKKKLESFNDVDFSNLVLNIQGVQVALDQLHPPEDLFSVPKSSETSLFGMATEGVDFSKVGKLSKDDKAAAARAQNLKIMGMENQVLQETIDGNYEAARALQTKVAIERQAYDEKTGLLDTAMAKEIEYQRVLTEGAATAQQLQGPYEKYKETLVSLQAQQAAGVISAQQMAQAQVMAAATAVSPWLNVAETVGTAFQTMFGESKAVSIAMAIINTLQGITTAIATYPPPLSYAMAAAQAALGFAQVAKIQSTTVGGSSGGGAGKANSGGSGRKGSSQSPARRARGGLIPGWGGGDIVPALLEPGEFIINKNASARNRSMLHAINSNRMAAGGVAGGTTYSGGGSVGGTTIIFSGVNAIDEIGLTRLERRLSKRGKRADVRRYGVTG